MVFSDFEKFGKIRQKIVDFWPKNGVFRAFFYSDVTPWFRSKITSPPWEMIRLVQKLVSVYLRVIRKKVRGHFLEFLIFSVFIGPAKCKKCDFWGKNDDFLGIFTSNLLCGRTKNLKIFKFSVNFKKKNTKFEFRQNKTLILL